MQQEEPVAAVQYVLPEECLCVFKGNQTIAEHGSGDDGDSNNLQILSHTETDIHMLKHILTLII